MGKANASLIRDLERARREGRDMEPLRLRVEESQRLCPHIGESAESILKEDSVNHKYRRGGRLRWCLDCSMVTHYTPPG